MFIQTVQHWHPDFIHQHPYALIAAYIVVSNAISALPAPTAKSSAFYSWLFKFANGIGGNLARAFNTTIEKSPNWQAAVDQHVQQQNGADSGRK